MLSYYKPDEPLEVQCDSSQAGLGAALMQVGHPVAYASRVLMETESCYTQIKKKIWLLLSLPWRSLISQVKSPLFKNKIFKDPG